ncbi:hypothetical protein B0T20DRAFT_389768 [Sordaria brevicollis]|uniref:Uncharacterized protein n=1 Tax=Sordaria brevicollis TaxID=83679 RepID=A0AAE0PKW6_SORBR|nr:hypothetical protein B0T20DRAFT_389768 [Sordaria brevicollis]
MPRTLATARRLPSNQPRCRDGGINHRKRLAHSGINPPRMTAPGPRHPKTLEKIFEAAVAEAQSDSQLEDGQTKKDCDMEKKDVNKGEKKATKKEVVKKDISKNSVAAKSTAKPTTKKSLAKKK